MKHVLAMAARWRKKKMTMVKRLDADPSTLDSLLEELRSDETKKQIKIHLIFFLADDDPTTQLSWCRCPDCVRAEPVINKTLEELPEDALLIRAYAGNRTTWRNPAHPWRADPLFNLTGVPTLVRWDENSIKRRLEDHEAHIPHNILSLLASP